MKEGRTKNVNNSCYICNFTLLLVLEAGGIKEGRKKKMIIALFKDEGRPTTTTYLFDDYSDFNSFMWDASTRYIKGVELKITGKTYQERKTSLQNLVLNISDINEGGLSYMELVKIDSFLETNARRYGLITEFKENYII